MPTIKIEDGTEIFYKEWGTGQPVVFSHGWPLNADVWDNQMFFLQQHGYRVIAHDRRGHGRSSDPGFGQDMDHFADDLAALTEVLGLEDAVHIGHSTGGGEVARYIARHGTRRVAKAVLVSAVPPLMVKTDTNPDGLPISVFDELRANVMKDRSQAWKDVAVPFFGANRAGSKVSQGTLDMFWLMGMQCSLHAAYDCIRAFSQTDQTEDLKAFDVPTLFVHGDDDQIVPIGAASMKAATLVKGSILKVYEGAPHGLSVTLHQRLNDDLLTFIRD